MTTDYTVRPAATRVDVEHTPGEPFILTVPILDATGAAVEILADAVGSWSVRGQVRRNRLSAGVLHEWSTTATPQTAVIVPGPAAAVRLVSTSAVTATWLAWADWSCAWDVWLTEPDLGLADLDDAPSPYQLVRGDFALSAPTTRIA